MSNQDSIMRGLIKEKELLGKLSQGNELGEINDVLEYAENPKVQATLMFRFIQEKDRTNKLLEAINDKYDKIMFALKTQNPLETQTQTIGEVQENQFEVLPEQDQLILKIIDERGQCSANDIKTMLNYKGLNAACQRLNKLYKEGHLKKVKSGKKVLYLAKS